MCGPAEMDGFVFASGLHQLQLPSDDRPGLEDLVRPVVNLIQGAIFRPRDMAYLDPQLASLGELIEMHHIRKAGWHHDKIYALLGMSSDRPHPTNDLLKYETQWKDIFKLLVKFILNDDASVEVYSDPEIAAINVNGYVLGQVTSVERDQDQYDKRRVTVCFTNEPNSVNAEDAQDSCWVIRATAKPVRQGDLVCLFAGASKPSIVRRRKDHFAIIVISTTPQQTDLPLPRGTLRKFLLIWDWNDGTITQNYATTEGEVNLTDFLPEYDVTSAMDADHFLNMALVLQDGGAYVDAETYLQRLEMQHPAASPYHEQFSLASLDSRAFMSIKMKDWDRAAEVLTAALTTKQKIYGTSHAHTLDSIANRALVYLSQDLHTGWEGSTNDLLRCIKAHMPILEIDIIQVIRSADLALLAFLLSTGACVIHVTDGVVEAAASARVNGLEMMKLLLEQREHEINITEPVIHAVTWYWQNGRQILEVLLEQCGNGVKITEEAIQAAAGNEWYGESVMSMFLKQPVDEATITTEVVKAAFANQTCGINIIKLIISQREDDILIRNEVVKAAFAGGFYGMEIVNILVEQHGDEIKITQEMVDEFISLWKAELDVRNATFDAHDSGSKGYRKKFKMAIIGEGGGTDLIRLLIDRQRDEIKITGVMVQATVASWKDGVKTIKLLLEQRGDEFKITEEVLKAAGGNKKHGKEMIQLLLEQRGDEIKITEEVLKAAVGSGMSGKETIEYLLEQRGDDIQITEEVLRTAAGNGRHGKRILEFLFEYGGAEIKITEEVLRTAAGNGRSGKEILEFLLKYGGAEIKITKEVTKTATKNKVSGEEILELLLRYRKAEMMKTEEVTAEIMKTEEVTKTITVNERSGKEKVQLLLEYPGGQYVETRGARRPYRPDEEYW
jgi:hypothetical protein